MATGDIQARNPLSDVQNILNIFRGTPGSTQTSTSTDTVSNDKAKSFIQQILESNSGLAAVSSGQKAAGMYGSTVNTQLTNDLLARTAAQTAALSSTKTNTVTAKGSPQLDLGKTLLTAGLGQLLTPVAKAGSKKLGLDKLGSNISDALFGDNTSSALGSIDPMGTPNIAAFSPSNLPINTEAINNISNLGDLSGMGGNAGGGGDGSGSSGFSAGDALGAAAGTAAFSSMLGSAGTAAALTDTSFAIGGTGTFLAADAAAAATGAEIAGTAATAVEGAGALDAIGTALAAAVAWIVCTELNKQGRLPHRYYIYGAREFAKYDERGKQGYYIWAIPSVKHLRKHPTSKYSKLLEIVFNARAEYLSAKAGCKGARKTLFGAITTHGLYGFCWILSRTIARKPVSREQILGIGA